MTDNRLLKHNGVVVVVVVVVVALSLIRVMLAPWPTFL
jgi:hypothetical protein